MDAVKFKLFQKNKTSIWSRNWAVYGGLVLSIITIIPSYIFFQGGILFTLGALGLIAAFLCGLYFSVSRHFEVKPLYGNLDQELIFEKTQIYFGNRRIPLEQIKKIEFDAKDYYRKYSWFTPSGGDLSPRLSNGTENFIILYFESGKTYSRRFEVYYQGEFQKKMKTLLIHYHRQEKMHFLKLIESLGMDKYEEIQEFKKEIGI